jgi:hypothetical protein
VTSLLRSKTPGDADLAGLRSRVAEIEGLLAARSAEVARVRSELDAFGISYRQQVGLLHEQLDDLERAIDEAELGERAKRMENTARGPAQSSRGLSSEAAPRYTSDVVRRLFRDVAKAIHPDLARNEMTRDRRHTLMVEANRAYASGDEEQLRSILHAWQSSPEAVPDGDPEATRLRLVRRIAQAEEEFETFAKELTALKASPLGKLKAMVDDAAGKRRDLVSEMVARLKRDIMVARNRLDAGR